MTMPITTRSHICIWFWPVFLEIRANLYWGDKLRITHGGKKYTPKANCNDNCKFSVGSSLPLSVNKGSVSVHRITILTLSLVNLLASRDREKYEQLVEDNYSVQEPKRVGVMQMSRVSSYSDCECDQQMQVGVYDLYALSDNWYGMCRPSFAERQKDPDAI